MQPYADKDIIIFDLDGTLTESKAKLTPDMARAIGKLLAIKKVAVIGGGKWSQFEEQFVRRLKFPRPHRGAGQAALLENLYLFPTNATAFHCFKHGGWKEVYRKNLSVREKKSIRTAFAVAFRKTGYVAPKKTWGAVIEDRQTEMTFSALGQGAPLREKIKWNAAADVRLALMASLKKSLPKFEIREGGETSIDVTRKGIDKAYGVRMIAQRLKTPISRMIFIGDALYKGGNDAAAKKTGIQCVPVKDPKDTKKIIEKIVE